MQSHHHDLRNSPLDQLTPLPSIRFLNQQNVPIQRNRNLSSISADQKAEITRKKFDALESNLTRTLITVANLKKTLLHNQNSNNPTPVKPLYAYACREEETDYDDDNNNISSSSWLNYYLSFPSKNLDRLIFAEAYIANQKVFVVNLDGIVHNQ